MDARVTISGERRRSAGALNTVIDNVAGSRPAARRPRCSRAAARLGSQSDRARGNQPSQNSHHDARYGRSRRRGRWVDAASASAWDRAKPDRS